MAELDEILYQLGVYPTQRGYQITNMAVTIGWREPEKLQMLTKWLYPAVERNLRATVNRAWDTNPGLVSQIAKRELASSPTAGDFVWMLCRYLTEKQEGA